MTIQISFSPDNGQLLGAQVAGYEGADKRLDILSSIIKSKGSIYDLVEFEHAYAPPYSSAKDPVNMSGFVAENILQKRLNVVYWNDVAEIRENDLLIDVRSPEEYSARSIPNAINIPIDDLRNRMKELPKDKSIYLFYQIGLRGYLAQRILLQNGYQKISNISGGYALWDVCTEEQVLSS